MGVFPWHHRWNVLAFTVFAQTVVVGLSYCFPFWVVPWADEFQVSHSRLMLIVSLSTLLVGLVSPFAGVLFERHPPRRLFLFGVTLLFLVYVGMSFTRSYWIILGGYGLLLPLALVLTTNLFSQIMVARWFDENRGFAMGISALGVSFGAFLLPPIATALLGQYGWHETFRILAFAALLLLVPTGLLVLSREPEASVGQAHPHGGGESGITTASLLKNPRFWLIAFGFGSITFACMPVQFGVGSYARDLGISQQQAAYAASLSAVSFACGKLGFGRLADWLPYRISYWIASVLILLGISVHALADGLGGFTFGLMLMTLGQGCVLPISSGMVIASFGLQAFSRVLGLLWLFIGLSMVSPYIAGLLREGAGGYPPAFLLLSLPLLLAAVTMRAMPARPTQS
jgi:MFS family permease